ncbi:hypothetical protein SAMN05216600_1349 [Pseudomonas cuatrocienegasensis]|uniref:Uncharacterized protein n=1 Tax=Pseudomonas cuatrocienegasensis TaxID=543360 RepID=A0ABY1BRR0_9PSED|nr:MULTISPECIES: hypothetical protein [Pseudomonas]OEC32587.1 hypothetical protein A7D25_23315 [Pseudomonas sp. 21C1]SER47019.1 hypothetical protein SAMN05216600_1349 [Pseudomonas cuatrocienegasensis]
MKTLLSDWCAFCEDKVVFDKSHFLGLLKAHNSNEELRQIFGYFPFAEDLVDRAARVISSGRMEDYIYLLPAFDGNESELIQLGGEWLEEQEKISGALGESDIFDICCSTQVLFVSEYDLECSLQEDIPHYWLFEAVGDAIRISRISDSKQIYALFEALYGLAADYYLAWYIGRPLFTFEINLEPYFRFWRSGGKCALTERSFLVSN